MAVTSLPQRYRGDSSHETMVSFFTKFDFKDMVKNKLDGENDVDAIVLDGVYVQLADCNIILEKKCSLEE